ncbi:MAG: ECF transporter S component [Chloroflexota bacterium]|nr:ECF transporter S component [Chloroflexota bacterium]
MLPKSIRLSSIAIYSTTFVLGVLSLIYPFIASAIVQSKPTGEVGFGHTPLMLTVLLSLSLVVLIYEVQGQVNTKVIALLGVLIAINASLRFIEVGIPGPGGFSPIFLLIILAGYLYGGRFGFLLGALTMLVSALVTGGFGPWLPSQMFAAGWVGMSAPLLRPFVRRTSSYSNSKNQSNRIELLALILFGFLWGFLYGVIMNLWSWPYFVDPAGQYGSQGISTIEFISRYASYYFLSSFFWDLSRAFGTALLLFAFGIPILSVLRRFLHKLTFQHDQTNLQEHQFQPAIETALKDSIHIPQ